MVFYTNTVYTNEICTSDSPFNIIATWWLGKLHGWLIITTNMPAYYIVLTTWRGTYTACVSVEDGLLNSEVMPLGFHVETRFCLICGFYQNRDSGQELWAECVQLSVQLLLHAFTSSDERTCWWYRGMFKSLSANHFHLA